MFVYLPYFVMFMFSRLGTCCKSEKGTVNSDKEFFVRIIVSINRVFEPLWNGIYRLCVKIDELAAIFSQFDFGSQQQKV